MFTMIFSRLVRDGVEIIAEVKGVSKTEDLTATAKSMYESYRDQYPNATEVDVISDLGIISLVSNC